MVCFVLMIQTIPAILIMVVQTVEVFVFPKTFLKAVEVVVFHHALMDRVVLTLIQRIHALH